ncbi:hypothetical protein L596_016786 [Steinernema carpocapsae]|uniref:Uncharacterized protein n=1 Tax=Steinernema carpocapsae TaxID=34508 RepID=A0A4U5NKH9_STECR|nr:hypothetical protein L596_016786 [Steinernema carpocapsae]
MKVLICFNLEPSKIHTQTTLHPSTLKSSISGNQTTGGFCRHPARRHRQPPIPDRLTRGWSEVNFTDFAEIWHSGSDPKPRESKRVGALQRTDACEAYKWLCLGSFCKSDALDGDGLRRSRHAGGSPAEDGQRHRPGHPSSRQLGACDPRGGRARHPTPQIGRKWKEPQISTCKFNGCFGCSALTVMPDFRS